MADRSIDVYYDYRSPFSYFASHRLADFESKHDVDVVWKPIDLDRLSNFETGLPYTPQKRAYVIEESIRLAQFWRIPIAVPDPFPVQSSVALRAALVAQEQHIFPAYHRGVFDAAWAQSRDIGDPQILAELIERAGGDARSMLEVAETPEMHARAIALAQEAEARGVFGVPTMILDEERFWGADRIELLEWRLAQASE